MRPEQVLLGLVPPRTLLSPLAVRALLAQIQWAMDQDPQLPFHGAALQPPSPSRADMQVQNPTLTLVKLQTVGDCPSLICLGLSALEGVNSSSQFGVSANLVSL